MSQHFGRRKLVLPYTGAQIVAGGPPQRGQDYLWEVKDVRLLGANNGGGQLLVTREVVEGPYEHCLHDQVYLIGANHLAEMNELFSACEVELGDAAAEPLQLIGRRHRGVLADASEGGRERLVVTRLRSPARDGDGK